MKFFSRKNNPDADAQPIGEPAETNAKLEIVAHKEAQADAIEQARKANDELHKLLQKNGFTIRIFLATGGPLPHDDTTESRK